MTTVERDVTELALFANFCADLRVESGKPMLLEPFQRTVLADFFAGTTESLILLPKKSGKSTLMAAVGLFHLLSVPDAEAVIAATSRDQASILLRQATGFVRRSEGLRDRLKLTQREIVNPTLGGRLRVIAAGVDQQDGWLGSLAMVDEMHRASSSDLYGLLRDGLGPRSGQMLVISTAGEDELSPLGQLRTRAYELPTVKRDGQYRYARSSGGRFVLHEWALDNDQDAEDLELVAEANPASWQTIDRLRDARNSPSMTVSHWRRFRCGQWVRGEHSAVAPEEWDQLAVAGTEIPDGSPVWLGWDHAWRGGGDTCAIVPLWWAAEDRRVIGDPFVLDAPEGEILDDRKVVEVFNTARGRWRVQGVTFDPAAGAWALAQQIARDTGLQLIEASQRDGPMALADGRLLEAIRRRQLVHSGHPVLRQHVLNAIEKSVAGELFRFTRPKHGPRVPIDALTALSLCHSTALAEASAPKPDNSWYMF